MSFCSQDLLAVLHSQLPAQATGLVVALSGGADSSALLAALAALPASTLGIPVRAVHVDHGLQPAAAGFREACARLCDDLEVELTLVTIAVACASGVSIEAAAREARYRALAAAMHAGECLLTAHHRDDQAETLLLQALRGAGLKGLAAMPACRPWGPGWHLRPLLGVARGDLQQFAAESGIAGAEDPMNRDLRFDRAYLRSELWPRIDARWPGAAQALARTATHAAEAQGLLDAIAAADLGPLRDGEALLLPRLRGLAPARRSNAVRRWLQERAVQLPPTARLQEALRQVLAADDDHLPAVTWDRYALRRYRERLFVTQATPPRLARPLSWPIGERPALGDELELGTGLGALHLRSQHGGLDPARLPRLLNVAPRSGGEVLRPASNAATQTVQHLCQALGVLPWMRDALPFIYAGQELIGIGDLWLDARWCLPADERGIAFRWLRAPNIL
jgi:tRNA(Ile)-lysidine synthase